MPEDKDEIEEMAAGSSIAAADEAAVAAPADSSAATDETEADTLSLVRDVVGDGEEQPAEAASSAEAEEDSDSEAGEIDGLDEEDFTDVEFHKHPRFRALIKQRNSFRTEAQENKAAADQYRSVQSYLDQNGLTAEVAADALFVRGLANTNPRAAWERLKPFVKDLLIAAGEILPEDLQRRVEGKELTPEAALELSRAKAERTAFERQREEDARTSATRREQEAVNAVQSAVNGWLEDRSIKDPNFAAKEKRLSEKLAFIHVTEGRATTPDGAIEQLRKAYKAVNDEIGSMPAPKPAPVGKRSVTPVNSSSQVAAQARPSQTATSTMDIIKQTVGQRATA